VLFGWRTIFLTPPPPPPLYFPLSRVLLLCLTGKRGDYPPPFCERVPLPNLPFMRAGMFFPSPRSTMNPPPHRETPPSTTAWATFFCVRVPRTKGPPVQPAVLFSDRWTQLGNPARPRHLLASLFPLFPQPGDRPLIWKGSNRLILRVQVIPFFCGGLGS